MTATPAPFSVLFVCTGNICRSPIAERVFRARVPSRDIVFSSAGTAALVGEDMPPEARAVARELGADPEPHAARQLTPQLVEEADLVIALARYNRAGVVRMFPRASRFTFTLREAARLSTDLVSVQGGPLAPKTAPARLRAAVPALAARRGHVPPPGDPADDDVPDPYRRGEAAFALAGGLIDEASDRVIAALKALSAP